MNYVTIKLTDEQNKQHSFVYNNEESAIHISDDFINQICMRLNIGKVKYLHLTLGVNNIFLGIENYSLTDTVYISSFYNVKSYINILKVVDCGIHITEQNIEHLQVDSKSILIANCQINRMDIGINKWHSTAKERDNLYIVQSVDIRDCYIKKIDIFSECKKLNVQGSNVEEFNNIKHSIKGIESTVNSFHIWQNTDIKKLTTSNCVEKFKIEDSVVQTFLANSNCFINELEISNATIMNSYCFNKNNFQKNTLDTWQIIEKSAHNSHNLKLRTDALYNIVRMSSKNERMFDKIISKIFDFCAGYGYKPLRLIRASGIVICFNTIIFCIVQLIKNLNSYIPIKLDGNIIKNCIRNIIDNFLVSLSAFGGQSELTLNDGMIYWLGLIEYIVGVVFFAMFVNALYLRYKE